LLEATKQIEAKPNAARFQTSGATCAGSIASAATPPGMMNTFLNQWSIRAISMCPRSVGRPTIFVGGLDACESMLVIAEPRSIFRAR
jgi:hypothetical protein